MIAEIPKLSLNGMCSLDVTRLSSTLTILQLHRDNNINEDILFSPSTTKN